MRGLTQHLDQLAAEAVHVLVASVQESIDRCRVRDEPSRNQLQTTTLLDAIEAHGFDAARRDGERARAGMVV